jgi:hypothetical protein
MKKVLTVIGVVITLLSFNATADEKLTPSDKQGAWEMYVELTTKDATPGLMYVSNVDCNVCKAVVNAILLLLNGCRHFIINGVSSWLMRLIASFAKVEPSEPYDFNVSLVLGKIESAAIQKEKNGIYDSLANITVYIGYIH